MKTKYGSFTKEEVARTKKSLRGSIFLLLLCVDPDTSENYSHIDVPKYFSMLQNKLNGLNNLLLHQQSIINTMILLEAALQEYNSVNFSFRNYRKLIFDAGAEIDKIREED